MTAEQLTSAGYRRVSNSYRMVARIDRPDWKDVLAKSMNTTVADLTNEVAWEDQYRRVYSKDVLQSVPWDVFRKIPGSDHDRCGYIPKEQPK